MNAALAYAACPTLLLLSACGSTQASYDLGSIQEDGTTVLERFEHPLTAHVAGQAVRFDLFGDAEVLFDQPFPPAAVDANRKFHIASASKQFTGAAIALLHQRAEISLDDPVGDHVSPWPAYARDVTIRHLLQHEGGLPRYEGTCPTNVPGVLDFVNDESALVPRPDGSAYDPDVDPIVRYSNTGYVVLALVVEAVSGKTFPAFLEDEFFGPLGMGDTYVREVGGRKVPMVATHYADGVWATHGACTWIYGDGGVMTTLDDMGKWCAVYLESTGILNRSHVDMMIESGRGLDRGAFGLRYQGRFDVSGDGSDLRRRVVHGGSWQGAVTEFCWFPDDRIGVVLLFNGAAALDSDRAYTGGQSQSNWLMDRLCRAVFAHETPGEGLSLD